MNYGWVFTILYLFNTITFMKPMRITVLALLAFSLLLQNTCPFGSAGKTAFAASVSHRCPFQRHHADRQGAVDDNGPNKVVYPAFMMIGSFMKPSSEHFPIITDYVCFSSCKYANPFKDPLIKPPVA